MASSVYSTTKILPMVILMEVVVFFTCVPGECRYAVNWKIAFRKYRLLAVSARCGQDALTEHRCGKKYKISVENGRLHGAVEIFCMRGNFWYGFPGKLTIARKVRSCGRKWYIGFCF